MIITFCGFMGSGKSTLGRGLAAAYNCRFIDLDDYIEAKWAMSVSTIFEKKGEEWFRKEECASLQEIVEEYNYLNSKEPYTLVLALGGGTVTYAPSAQIVRNNTHCIYVQCPKEELLQRLIKNNSRRPLLAGKSEEEMSVAIDSLMARREGIYLECAHTVYPVQGKKLKCVILEFAQMLGL